VFKWLREATENKIVQSHLSEMMPYLRQLSNASDEDVAHIYLAALAYRNTYKKTVGIDLFNPQEAIEKNKAIALDIGAHIRDAQKSTLYVTAAGLKVWLFTIRSLTHDELRPIGVALWRQFPRGFPHVPTVAEAVYETTGFRNDLTDSRIVPLGFEPPSSDNESPATDRVASRQR
jgi:hypothetical protein